MRIETKYLSIELEPELLTDEHLARVQKLIALTSDYEKSRRESQKGRLKQSADVPGELKRKTRNAP